MSLPDTYQEVEWIGASGSQYINTGYVVNTNTSRIYSVFEPQNVSTSQGSSNYQNPLFGTRTSDYSYETALWASPSSQTYSVGLTLNGHAMDSATPSTGLPKYPLGTVIKLDYGKTGGTYNSFTFTWNAQYQGVTPNLLIFGIWSQGSVDARKFFGKLYSFKIYEGDNEVCNFIPCYRKSDNVIGLYDIDRNTFYTNSGSGTFTKGPDIRFYGKITHIYLGTNQIRPISTPPTPVGRTLFDDNFLSTTNAALQAEGWTSVGDSYGLTIGSNGLHWVTMETDTASGIEFKVTDNLVGKKFCWEVEGYAGTFQRRGNIGCSLDRTANYSNKRKKYDVVSTCPGWGMGLWSLPGYSYWDDYRYSGVSNGAMGFRNGTSSQNIDMWGDKGNKGLYWQPYNNNYSLDLPFTTGIYKGRGYFDFKNWVSYLEWETPNGTIKSFSRNFASDPQSSKDSLNTWLAGAEKYVRLTSGRGYGDSSDDVCYWRKAKMWYE